MHFVFCNKNIFRSVYTVSNASEEELLPGDMICYWHNVFVAGNPRGWTTATIRDIDPKRKDNPLRLDNMDCLNMYFSVAWYKILQPDGMLLAVPEPRSWRWIKEFKLKKSKPAPYWMSTEGASVGSLWRGLSDKYMGFAKEHGMSQDLMCRATTVQQNGSVGSNDSSDSDTSMGSEEPTNEHVLNKENCDNK
jgi:hypothetical protein